LDKQHFIYVALGVFVWAILGTVVAAYFYTQYNVYRGEYVDLANQLNNVSMKANILLSYGNGTRVWYNDTFLPLGSTAFTALNFTVDYLNYTDYGELGTLVTSINGVANNSTHGWLYWNWDSESTEWILPSYSSADYLLHEGDTIAYTYVYYVEWPPPTPT
jgi:hypothetical protein